MNATSFPIFMMLVLAVGAGLLAVFAVWVSKQIANEKTRSQGIISAGIAFGVLVLGFFVMGTRTVVHTPQVTLVPATTAEGSISMEQNGGMEVHVHSGHPAAAPPAFVAPPSVSVTNSGQFVGKAQFAWGPVMIAVIAVGIIAIVVSSRRGLAAALSCLGIVAAVMVMYVFAARSSHQLARVAEVAPGVDTAAVWDAGDERRALEVIQVPTTDATAEAAPEEVKAEADNESDQKSDSKSAADEEKRAKSSSTENDKPSTESHPPAWVGSEPTMEAGVYRAAVVSGPYSTKRECETQLDEPLRKAMMEYAGDHLPYNARFHAWGNASYIRDNLIEERYLEQEQYGVGKMYNLHVLLKVDADDVARFNNLAHEWRVRQAVEETSIGGLFVLGSLVVAYGALRYGCCKKRAGSVGSGTESPGEATV